MDANKPRIETRQLVTMAMLAALAFAAAAVTRIPLVAAAEFLKYEPKDVILAIGAFLYGPMAGAAMSAVVCAVEMVTISETGFYGFIMNWIASIAFICPAALLYRRRRTIGSAVGGLALGTVVFTATMLLWNYIITPLYKGWPRDAVVPMLLPVFLPFNAVKGGLNSALTLMLYQPVTNALRRSHLLPAFADGSLRRSIKPGLMFFSLLLLVTCILLVLALRGII